MKLSTGVVLSGFIAVFALVILLTVPKYTSAVEHSWVDYPDIHFSQLEEFRNPSEKSETRFGSNVDCFRKKITLKPAIPRVLLADTPAVMPEDCMVDARYATVGGSYYVGAGGGGIAGKLTLRGNKEFLIAGSNLSTGIIGDATAPTGVYINFALNINSQVEAQPQLDNSVKYVLKDTDGIINIKNAKNQRLSAMPETVAFSSNGNWMLFVSPYYGLARMSTQDGKILSFGTPTTSGNVNSRYNTAISADGRYAVVSNENQFLIYDLEACETQTGSLSYLMNCPSRSLKEQRLKEANYGAEAYSVRFESSDSFTYYTSKRTNGELVFRKYRVTMGDIPQYGFQYLGLGDSFASGEGAFRYKPVTEDVCHLSLESYPYLIGEELDKENYESIACSGAKSEDVVLDLDATANYKGQDVDGFLQKARELPPILNSFNPGKLTQNSFLTEIRPEAVTISIGGNDLGFADKIKECVIGAVPDTTCFDTVEDRKEVAEEIYSLSETLVSTYQNLAKQDRRVYVIGYPKILKPGGNCAVNVRLDASELAFADKLTTLINDAIEFAAGQAGVFYVDTEDILDGHRLCETESTQTYVHGLTEDYKNDDIQIAKESFHPKLEAQILYKEAILSQTNNLSSPMPSPDSPSFFKRLDSSDAFFSNLGSSGRQIYKPIYKDFVDERANAGDSLPININGRSLGLGGFAEIDAEIHSVPVSLGSFITDADGNLNINIQVPEDVEYGYHSLHLFGKNQAGQKIDIYDYVLIGSLSKDFDGDGILDKDEGCILTQPSGLDTDKDGVDDTCDGFEDPIVEPEVTPLPTFLSTTDPKDFDNGETVAGNEEMAEHDKEISESKPNAQTQAVVATRAVAVTNSSAEPVPAENVNNEEVLGAETNVAQDIGPVTVPESKADERTAEQNIQNKSVYLYYFIGAVVAFIGLVALIFIARRP